MCWFLTKHPTSFQGSSFAFCRGDSLLPGLWSLNPYSCTQWVQPHPQHGTHKPAFVERFWEEGCGPTGGRPLEERLKVRKFKCVVQRRCQPSSASSAILTYFPVTSPAPAQVPAAWNEGPASLYKLRRNFWVSSSQIQYPFTTDPVWGSCFMQSQLPVIIWLVSRGTYTSALQQKPITHTQWHIFFLV